MADDDCIVVAGGDPAAEFLAVLSFKVLLGGNEDIGGRIELQKLAGPLLRQMVGDDEQGFLTKAQPLTLHGYGHHFKGLARAHHMG